jgi:DNA-directed RNA polymerase subunit M/transcription elongation factor TFIIS
MNALDPAGEFLRLTERYRQMSDEELLLLVPQSSELTPLAQQALASEVRSRGLKPEAADEKPPARSPFRAPATFVERESPKARGSAECTPPDADPPCDDDQYAEDRKLVELCRVWSLADARQAQSLLDRAGIPFFMGPEKATSADAVTSNFTVGVSVQVMRIGVPWAAQVMQYYEPLNEPPRKPEEPPGDLVVRCPKCNSEEVVFEGGTSTLIVTADDPSQKYQWSCDACGYQWEDDGVAKEE